MIVKWGEIAARLLHQTKKAEPLGRAATYRMTEAAYLGEKMWSTLGGRN